MGLEFQTSEAQQKATVEVVIDDTTLVATAPKQAALLRLALSENGSAVSMTKANLDFTYSCLDQAGRDYIESRLNDPDDNLDVGWIVEILTPALIKEFTGRPTQSSSASTGRRRPTKKASTGISHSRASTRVG